jgi:hypothetical protein
MHVRATKRALFSVVWYVVLLGAPCLAQEEKAKTVFYSIGYRVWYSNASKLPTATRTQMEQNGYSVLSGPVASVTYGDWGFSAAYLFGSLDFKGVVDFGGDHTADAIAMGSDREDLDVALSFRATSFLRPFVGYKYVHVSVAEHIDTPAGGIRAASDITLGGPTIGLNLLFRPFKEDQFFVTGTLFYGFGNLKVSSEVGPADSTPVSRFDDSERTNALNWDVAIGCRLNKSLMASLGYKSQYVPRTGVNNDESQEISGFTLALVMGF